MKKFDFHFDVSWKGIVLTIVILAFLMGVIDTIVDAREIQEVSTVTVKEMMNKVQKIEDRELKIQAEEQPYFYKGNWFCVYDAKAVTPDKTVYHYRYYDAGDRKIYNQSIMLDNDLVDDLYRVTVNLSTDSIWKTAVQRICRNH